ncbi:9903_t:CDS:2, partial [Diversispora eburnea]
AYAHRLLRWINLKIQLNHQYMISGILDGLLEEENSITRFVIRATDSYSNFTSTNITNQQNRANKVNETPDLTDLLKSQRKQEISSKTIQFSHVNKNKKNSTDEDENIQTKSQVIAHAPYQNLSSQNKYYASFTQQTPQLSTPPSCEKLKVKSGRKRKIPTANLEIEKTKPVRKSPRKKNIGDLATMELENNVNNNINNHSLVKQMSSIEKINEELSE